ncbi:hypothetical protein C2G38_2245257 [Gigaspora rosea]|uniref:Transmembrane protein n=1 Tax=Gigaspora rosea TaxID=44941 RepID=A0A397VD53_9GLOM|nr:hypothetical protein C2G38_2245257 [Gigaspora rosea]
MTIIETRGAARNRKKRERRAATLDVPKLHSLRYKLSLYIYIFYVPVIIVKVFIDSEEENLKEPNSYYPPLYSNLDLLLSSLLYQSKL